MKQDPKRQQRFAAQRAANRRRQVRNRILLAAGSIVAVAAVVVALVLVKVGSGPGTAPTASEGPTDAALRALVAEVTSVPSSTLARVGAGNLTADFASDGSLANVSGRPLASGGKPEVLYVGANFCPFCAAERWAMIVALSRFGTFTGLSTTQIANLPPYGPQYLAGKTWAQVAAALRDPSNEIAQGVDGSANYLTAGICQLTGNQPATACTATVRGLEGQL